MADYTPSVWHWIVGGDESRFWSSAHGEYIGALPEGAGVTRIASEMELTEVLASNGLPGPIAARRMIRKSIVQQRLIGAGLMEAAYAALTSQPVAFARWFAPDHPEVYADDPDALALIAALGADAETVMAPGP